MQCIRALVFVLLGWAQCVCKRGDGGRENKAPAFHREPSVPLNDDFTFIIPTHVRQDNFYVARVLSVKRRYQLFNTLREAQGTTLQGSHFFDAVIDVVDGEQIVIFINLCGLDHVRLSIGQGVRRCTWGV